MRTAKLGDLVSITGGGTPDRSMAKYWNGQIPWVTVKDFKGKQLSGAQEHITQYGLAASASNLIPTGCIILPTRMALGKAAINTIPVAINQDLKALRIVDERVILRDYLFQHLLSKAAYFESQGKGATVKGITLNVLRDLDIPLPDINQQQRIAVILDKADRLRRKRQEAIRLADEFLQASYLELASRQNDRVTIDSVLADIPNAARTGPFGSQMLVSEFQESGIPVLGIDNVVQNRFCWGAKRFISEAKYKELERYTVRPGDVMVTIMGTTGRVAIAPQDIPTCISTKHLCTLTLNRAKMLPEYLWASLRWDPEVKAQTQREAKGAIMDGWNMGIVKALEVRQPSLEEQQIFVNKVHTLRRLQSRTEESLSLTDDLVSSLTNQFFNQ